MHPLWFIVIGMVGIALYMVIMHFIILGAWALYDKIRNLICGDKKKGKQL